MRRVRRGGTVVWTAYGGVPRRAGLASRAVRLEDSRQMHAELRPSMSVEFNKALVRRYFDELLNQGRLKVAEEILSSRDRVLRSLWDLPGSRSLAAVFLNGPQGLSGPPLHGRTRHSRRRHGGESASPATALTWESFMASERFKVLRRAAGRFPVKGVSIFQTTRRQNHRSAHLLRCR